MDDIVRQAIAKWPNVPHAWGWLGLDARGDWYLRDEAAQAAGPFPRSRGSRIEHDKLAAFIGRNYEHDDDGRWFFQNGPQRVFVELEAAPWIWRVQDDGSVVSHTGQPAEVRSAWLDEQGRLYAETPLGLGLVHSLDVEAASRLLDDGRWTLAGELRWDALAQRFGFVPDPAVRHAAAAA